MTWAERTSQVARVTTEIRLLCPWLAPYVAAGFAIAFVDQQEADR